MTNNFSKYFAYIYDTGMKTKKVAELMKKVEYVAEDFSVVMLDIDTYYKDT